MESDHADRLNVPPNRCTLDVGSLAGGVKSHRVHGRCQRRLKSIVIRNTRLVFVNTIELVAIVEIRCCRVWVGARQCLKSLPVNMHPNYLVFNIKFIRCMRLIKS